MLVINTENHSLIDTDERLYSYYRYKNLLIYTDERLMRAINVRSRLLLIIIE